MVLRPHRMVKVRIIAGNSRRREIISVLRSYGMVQLERVDPTVAEELGSGTTSPKLEEYNKLLQTFRSYENLIPPSPVKGKRLFKDEKDLMAEIRSIDVESELLELKHLEDDILSDIKDIRVRIEAVEPLKSLPYDLGIYNSSRIKSYITRSEDDISELIRKELKDAVITPLPDNYYLISIRSDQDKDLARVATNNHFTLMHVPEIEKSPSVYLEYLKKSLAERERELSKVNDRLKQISKRYYSRIAQIREELEILVSNLDVAEKLPRSKDIFALEGWMKKRDLDPLRSVLSRISSGRFLMNVVKTDEEAPTLLANHPRLSFFEFFIRFYSLPKEAEFDPTLIFAVVFPIFFALMVGDWGYGLSILLGALWLKHRIEHPPRVSHLPKKLSTFVGRIFGPGPLLILAKTLIPSGILAIVVGLLFDNFFGFQVLHALFGFNGYDVQKNVPQLLLISGYIGIVMVAFGLILGAIDNYVSGRKKESAGKVGWLLFAVGIVILGLNVLHRSFVISGSSPSSLISLGMVISGIILIALMEGGQSVIELSTMISHILSFTRIVGVLLASVILAFIVDLPFSSGGTSSLIGTAMAVMILVLGQMFNLIIAIFEPGIQGARLIYVEFFSKFYHGGGKPFRPFAYRRRYTRDPYDPERTKAKN